VDALRPGDVVLILTSGDLNGSLETLSEAVAERFGG
jgi:hypothetical protein